RLLIVDDEAPLLRALCDTLQHEGYLTQAFTSGREALAALREHSFDLPLTDLTMPELAGIALLRACRELDRELPCIVMTGQTAIRACSSRIRLTAGLESPCRSSPAESSSASWASAPRDRNNASAPDNSRLWRFWRAPPPRRSRPRRSSPSCGG